MEKKCKTEKEKGRRRPRSPAARPSQPSARTQAQQAGPGYRGRPRAQPRQLLLPPWPRASATCCPPARPSSLRRSCCQRTPPVSHPLLIFPTPRPTVSRSEADSECRAGQGVTPEPWPCPPWRSAHANAMPTTHAPQAARCARRDPQPPPWSSEHRL